MNNLLHARNNSSISKINNQHNATIQPASVVCISKIMHNIIKAGHVTIHIVN